MLTRIRLNVLFTIFRVLQGQCIHDRSGKMRIDRLIDIIGIAIDDELHNALVFLNNPVP